MNTNEFSILYLDRDDNTNTPIKDICSSLNINHFHTQSTLSTLEMLMDISVDIIIINLNVTENEVVNLLTILNEDIENKSTPIIIISDLVNNEKLAKEMSSFNVISIISYLNYSSQLINLLNLLKSNSLTAFTLKKRA